MTGRLVLACAVLLPGALHAQGVPSAREQAMRDENWGPYQQPDGTYAYVSARSDEELNWYRDLLDRAQWSDVSGIDCGQHQTDMETFLNGAPMYWARDARGGQFGRDGQTLRAEDAAGTVEFLSVFNWEIDRSDDAMLDLLLHEGWHWVRKETEEGTDAEDAERCASISLEEEDDPGDPGGTTCTDEEYTYTEWDWVWTEIEAGSCVGVSPVRWPWEEGGDDEEMHCTPAKWGYVLMEVEKTGVRTVCVTTSN